METEKSTNFNLTWKSYLIFAFALVFFSGFFTNAKDWTQVLDFSVLNGSFGKLAGANGGAFTFKGAGGSGAREGFLFAVELIPAVVFALGFVSIVEGYGGLRVAQKIMTPFLKPLLGIPGICGFALISNLQSTDAGAGMTKELYEAGEITDEERTIFATYQISASATISNYFGSGIALFSVIMVPILLPFFVMFLFKIIAANFIRFYIQYEKKRAQKKESEAKS